MLAAAAADLGWGGASAGAQTTPSTPSAPEPGQMPGELHARARAGGRGRDRRSGLPHDRGVGRACRTGPGADLIPVERSSHPSAGRSPGGTPAVRCPANADPPSSSATSIPRTARPCSRAWTSCAPGTASRSRWPTAAPRSSSWTGRSACRSRGFPTAEVYGPTPDAQLRLITCDGPYDRAAGRYLHNLVVFATLASN